MLPYNGGRFINLENGPWLYPLDAAGGRVTH